MQVWRIAGHVGATAGTASIVGKVRPSTDALERFAQATHTRLHIVFEPNAAH